MLVPVIRTIHQAMRRSSRCLTMATASISEPMMNSTESVIRLWATLVGSVRSSTTSPMMIISGTVGSGTASVTNSMVAISDMHSTIWPSWVRPAGVGRPMSVKPDDHGDDEPAPFPHQGQIDAGQCQAVALIASAAQPPQARSRVVRQQAVAGQRKGGTGFAHRLFLTGWRRAGSL